MSNFNSVVSAAHLDYVINELQKHKIIAVDTESDSLYSYFEKVCLLQISTTTANYIIDPLVVDISPIAPIFATKQIEKIFHAAEHDVMTLKRDHGFEFSNLFDTRLAAKILGWPRQGLADILEAQFQVRHDKRFQRYNWGKRPLDGAALNYAYLDTFYLIKLRHLQYEHLQQKNLWGKAKYAFQNVVHVKATPKIFNPTDFWQIKEAKSLKPHQQTILRDLFVLRDQYARQLNRPPFKVINNATLCRLVKAEPNSLSTLKQIKGLSTRLIDKQGTTILAIFKKALTSKDN